MTFSKLIMFAAIITSIGYSSNIPDYLLGTWSSGCSTDDPIVSSWDNYKISKNSAEYYGTVYDGPGCLAILLTWKAKLNLVIGKKSEFIDDATEVDMHYSNHEITMQSLSGVYAFNTNKVCGFNDWKLFVPKSIPVDCKGGLGIKDKYTIFAVRREGEGIIATNHLYYGGYYGDIYDGSTPELRRRELYESFHTRSLLP